MSRQNKSMAKPTCHELLIEIGTEEMPANYLAFADAGDQDLFRKKFVEVFKNMNNTHAFEMRSVDVFVTPRRIILHCNQIEFNPSTQKEAVYGPSVQQALDKNHAPTPALTGFMKSKGIRRSDLVEFDHRGKRCLGYWKEEAPTPLNAVLPEFMSVYIRSLSFPKTMKWDNSDLRFPRPIRSVLCFLDDKKVEFKLGNVKSGNTTYFFLNGNRRGHRIKGIRDYFKTLRKMGVVYDALQRTKIIEREVRRLTLKHKGDYRRHDSLIQEVCYLTERPVAIIGRFDEQFSYLPPDVLKASLSKNQRLFSVLDKSAKHLPLFIGFLDGNVKNKNSVIRNVSMILRAKLQDSDFFFREDLKLYGTRDDREGSVRAGIGNLKNDLKNLIYLRGAGTMHDRVQRLDKLTETAELFGSGWGQDRSMTQNLKKAVEFSKLDLLTQMVGEFPELQGVIGGEYVKIPGVPLGSEKDLDVNLISQAIGEHYRPTTIDGPLPETKMGGVLALLDKMDLLVSCFVIGKSPSASQDPHGLKRSLTGIFRIAMRHTLDVSWKRMTSALLDIIDKQGICKTPLDAAEVKKNLTFFYMERLGYYFENQGYSRDLVQAVLATEGDRLLRCHTKLRVLNDISSSDSFQKTLKVIQRTTNILKSVRLDEIGEVRPEDFTEDLETRLFNSLQENSKSIMDMCEQGDIEGATNLYADAFFDILHLFFERVLVHVDQPEIRRNRLSLLASVKALYVQGVADLSKIYAHSDMSSHTTRRRLARTLKKESKN